MSPNPGFGIASQPVEVFKILTGDEDTRCFFQGIYEQGKRPTHTLIGTVEEHFAKLARWNEKGYGIYICVNKLSGEIRNDASVTKIRAVFADDDANQDLSYPISPSFIIGAARGSHPYWILEDEISKREFTQLQKAIAKKLKTDPAVCDPPGLSQSASSSRSSALWTLEESNLSFRPRHRAFGIS